MRVLSPALTASPAETALDVTAVCQEHGRFIWNALIRLGVRPADAEDALQEVLVVVHRRLASYDPEQAALTSWLFGIAVRVASSYRRRAHRRREVLLATVDDTADPATPESELVIARRREELTQILDTLSPVKRATFVMFELEGLSCEAIANVTGVALGTVHSRLFSARRDFERALRRRRSREGGGHG